MELLLQTYNKYTDRLKGKPTECKLACIHKWISVLFVSISLYLFINETGELLFIFIMRKPKMETNALARYKIFFFLPAVHVVSYRWLIDNQMDRTFHTDLFMAHLRGWLERRLSISGSNPTTLNLLYGIGHSKRRASHFVWPGKKFCLEKLPTGNSMRMSLRIIPRVCFF